MVRLFYSKNNLTKGNIRSYLLYALGETLLVVLGILIALKVNNMNESRILTETTNEYLIKIKSNINEDIFETVRILNFRNEHADLCNEVSEKLIANDFEDQLKIQQAIVNMIIEIELNYNRTAFESLKTSGHLSHLKNPVLEELLYDYYLRTDQVIMRENDQKDWANILENELDRIGFFYEWSELDKKVITDLFSLFTNYTEDLKAHPGHKIIMRLLFRGGTNKTILTPLYEDHIRLAKEVVNQIDEYLNS